MTTGYAFVLYEIMRRHGLDKDKGDYEIVRAGGMVQRWNALREGQHAATLLSAPYNIIAKNAGFTEFVKATDVIGPYQGNVAAVRRPWARDNRAQDRSLYPRLSPGDRLALRAAEPQRGDCDPASPSAANAAGDRAKRATRNCSIPRRGFFRNCEIDRAGLDCVLELRSRYGSPSRLLNDPAKYCDLSYSEDAR